MKETLKNEYNILEQEGKKLLNEFHKDAENREKILNEAMGKIFKLKFLAENNVILSDLVLLGDEVELEMDYGSNVDVIETKLTLDSQQDTITLFSPVGCEIFAKKVGEKVKVPLPAGEMFVTILSKNKNKSVQEDSSLSADEENISNVFENVELSNSWPEEETKTK